MEKSTGHERAKGFISGEGLVATLRDGASGSSAIKANADGKWLSEQVASRSANSNVECVEEQAGQFDDASVDEDPVPPASRDPDGEDSKLPPTGPTSTRIETSSVFSPGEGNPLAPIVSISVTKIPAHIASKSRATASLSCPYPIAVSSERHEVNNRTRAGARAYEIDIGCNDVLCGRSHSTNSHPGNVFFRGLLRIKLKEYISASEYDRSTIAIEIVDVIRGLTPSGRFLKKHPRVKGIWIEIGNQRAREKTAQALHNGCIIGKKSDPDLDNRNSVLRKAASENGTEPPRRKKRRVSSKMAKSKTAKPSEVTKSAYRETINDSSGVPDDRDGRGVAPSTIGNSTPALAVRMVPTSHPLAAGSDLLHNNPAYHGMPLLAGSGRSFGGIRHPDIPTPTFGTPSDIMHPLVSGARIPFLLGRTDPQPPYLEMPTPAALTASSDLAFPAASAASAPYLSGHAAASLSQEIAASRLLLQQHPAFAHSPNELRLASDEARLLLGIPPFSQQVPGASDQYLTQLALARLRQANGFL